MSLLLTASELRVRAGLVKDPLQPLAHSLATDLREVAARELYFPEEKAVLSREGGRCARDGTLLEFDPFQPREHRCARCGQVYRGAAHDRFWIYWYQLWLAERAVHAAVLSALGVDPTFARLAESILDGYADRYASYPNVDNVLGPTRLFFSTYIEAIWLLQICIATDLIAETNPALAARVRERIVEPSRAIIVEYDEGASNRQVWNDAALLAAARLLNDDKSANDAVFGRSGIVEHLSNGLLGDGTWYEGENYHLFAHRGLWYGVTLAENAGLEIPAALVDRFQRGFATPFVSALPDFTFPSRRDSQYAVSLRQWRIAEHCELGIARSEDPLLLGALERMYCDDGPRHETGRRTSSADVERNHPATSLTRADLSWRALLFARPKLPPLEPNAPQSALLEAQGLGVFRRALSRVYVALDYGTSGGGHGHPDRLNLLLSDGDTRWLDDFGTGSYVDSSLHWYRSTLAHNAPLVNGVSQRQVDGILSAHDERGAVGWISATADVADSVHVERTVIVMSEYLVDETVWRADREVVFDLPIHANIELSAGVASLQFSELRGGEGIEDGFPFARQTARQFATAGVTVRGGAASGEDKKLSVWSQADRDVEWWRIVAPGPPGYGDKAFRMVRAKGSAGMFRSVYAWSADVEDVAISDEIRVTLADGSSHLHRRTAAGWHVELRAGSARSGIDLDGRRQPTNATVAPAGAQRGVTSRRLDLAKEGRPISISLGEAHYRRSEQTWEEAGKPVANVALSYSGRALRLAIDVEPSGLTFVRAAAVNPYDNEHPDVNGDGVQLFVSSDRGLSGWMLVPESASSRVRVRQIEGWPVSLPISATWSKTRTGYRIDVRVDDCIPRALDVLINEKPPERERRRGQFVLSGAVGEFVYLRGDRYDINRLIAIRLVDD